MSSSPPIDERVEYVCPTCGYTNRSGGYCAMQDSRHVVHTTGISTVLRAALMRRSPLLWEGDNA